MNVKRNGIPIGDPTHSCRNKDTYGNKREADGFAAFLRYRGRAALTSYQCAACGSWHLTKASAP